MDGRDFLCPGALAGADGEVHMPSHSGSRNECMSRGGEPEGQTTGSGVIEGKPRGGYGSGPLRGEVGAVFGYSHGTHRTILTFQALWQALHTHTSCLEVSKFRVVE